MSIGSFLLAIIFSLLSETMTRVVKSVIISLSGLLFIILIGILADIIGTAATAAQEAPFLPKPPIVFAGQNRAFFSYVMLES